MRIVNGIVVPNNVRYMGGGNGRSAGVGVTIIGFVGQNVKGA
ncbi:MAG: hypothetical protein R3316_10915 [Rhodovibrionaceae bacterium]|nr:hypothetical protein [Rhodovibrionaceae bacterium]